LAYASFIEYFSLNGNTIGAFNSAYYAASGIGTVMNWYLPNEVGRLQSIRFGTVVTLVGITLQTAAQNYAMFIVGRVLGGLGGGMLFSLAPVYASEISPPKLRGRVGAFYAYVPLNLLEVFATRISQVG
jgi:predicted MFS family arabinose efflux permease